MIASFPSLTPVQWLALAHPVLIILFVYPVIGATIRLGILAGERRLQINPIAATVPVEHADHGRWATGGLLLAVLLAFSHALASTQAGVHLWGKAAVAASVAVGSFALLLRSRRLVPRLIAAWVCWLMLLLMALQPLPGAAEALGETMIWHSHTWGGLLLLALLLLTMAVQREIASRLWLRRMHVLVNGLVALLLATQAISGTRDLLLH